MTHAARVNPQDDHAAVPGDERAGPDQALPMAPSISQEEAASVCRRLLNIDPVRVEYPGGRSRRSVRAVIGDSTLIVTRRKHGERAALEAGVLRELRAAGAPVPQVLAFDGQWLIQQDLGPRRLAVALGAADLRSASHCAAQAAAGLLLCQLAARKCGLDKRVAPIGVKPEWMASLLTTPARLAEQLGLPDPEIGAVMAPEHIAPRQLSFVKWDARPGNAVLVNHGADNIDTAAAWIDWEHCGARDALDDLAWLLCDEYMPDDVELETALLKRFLPLFALHSKRSADDALAYLSRFGTLHTCMRLHLVLRLKGNGAWWNPAAVAHTDRVGVTAQAAQRLCARGARWSGRWAGGERMSRFFSDADKRLRALSTDSNAARARSPALV